MLGGDAGGESPLTKRKMVALLAGAIQRARDKGYTLKQIVGQLQNNGFDIGHAALFIHSPAFRSHGASPRTHAV